MIEDFSMLLKNLVKGDLRAWYTLQEYFAKNLLNELEQTQLHLYLKKSAEQYTHSIYLRGLLYENGFGVAKDPEMAFLLMREAAARGHSAATFDVGRHFYYGIGVEKNMNNAFQWITVAAESPHYYPEAMFYLGKMYEQGLGIPVNEELAHYWFQRAKLKGFE